MKLQWKLVIALLVGLLAIGQMVAIHHAIASKDTNLQTATTESLNASQASQVAQAKWNAMQDEMKKMMTMPMTDNEKEMMKGFQMQQDFNQQVLLGQVHLRNAIDNINTHLSKNQ